MATKNAAFNAAYGNSNGEGDGSYFTVTWILNGTDDGAPIQYAQWADKSVQVGISTDTFGAGTVVFEGSNDGLLWTTLSNPASTALTFTAAGLKQILETTAFVRPRASVAVTTVTVVLFIRRNQPMRT